MTTIQDQVTYADGSLASGQIVLSWPIFTLGGVAIAAGQQTYPIVNGTISIPGLYPNLNAQPFGVYYTATYELDSGAVYDEYWIVPNKPSVTVAQVRAQFPETPSIMINAMQLTGSGATPGQFLGWNGTSWVPMYPSLINFTPNTIGLTLTATPGDVLVTSSPAYLGNSLVLNVPDAGPTSRGVVNTGAQTFSGNKTFLGGVTVGSLTVTGPGGPVMDPTTTKGDLIVRGAVAPPTRLGVGADGFVLMADSTQMLGTKWAAAPGGANDTSTQRVQVALAGTIEGTRPELNFIAGSSMALNVQDNPSQNRVDITLTVTGSGGAPTPSIYAVNGTIVGTQSELNLIAGSNVTLTGVNNTGAGRVDITVAATGGGAGAVSSVFGRTGSVVAQAGDYTAAEVTNAVSMLGSYADPVWITSLSWSKITGAPSVAGVTSFNTRTGAVMPAPGDYTAAQVTNAVSAAGSYVDPAWITSLSYSKLTGAPAIPTVYWQAGSGGAIYYNGGNVGIGIASPGAPLHVKSTGAVQLLVEGPGDSNVFSYLTLKDAGSSNIWTLSHRQDHLDSLWLCYNWSLTAGIYLLPSGNVGIGTTSPSAALHVVGSSSQPIWVDTSSSTGSFMAVRMGGSTKGFFGYLAGYNGLCVLNAAGNIINLMVADNGNIGIGGGTTMPAAPLTVTSSSGQPIAAFNCTGAGNATVNINSASGHASSLSFANTNANQWYLGNLASNNLVLLNSDANGNATILTAQQNGYVGIGTTSPSGPLHVVGTAGYQQEVQLVLSNDSSSNTYSIGRNSSSGFLVFVGYQASFSGYTFSVTTASGALTALTITNSGNVGIGTISATVPLTVLSDANANAIRVVGRASDNISALSFASNNQGAATYLEGNGTSIWIPAGNFGIGGAPTTGPLWVHAATNENFVVTSAIAVSNAVCLSATNDPYNTNTPLEIRASLTVFSTGNVGVGMSPGSSALCVGAVAAVIQLTDTGSGGATMFLNTRIGGAVGLVALQSSGNIAIAPGNSQMAVFTSGGYLGINTPNPIGQLHVHVGTNLNFVVLPNGTSNVKLAALNDAASAYMPITVVTTGVAIGTGSLVPAYTLDVQGQIRCQSGGYIFPDGTTQATAATSGTPGITSIACQASGSTFGTIGAGACTLNITGSGQTSIGNGWSANNATWNVYSASDARAKQNIETLTGGLEAIERLRPVRAEWNGAIRKTKGEPLVGVIAQEVQAVIPEAVYTVCTRLFAEDKAATDVLGLEPVALIAHLILAVQQLTARIKQLEGVN